MGLRFNQIESQWHCNLKDSVLKPQILTLHWMPGINWRFSARLQRQRLRLSGHLSFPSLMTLVYLLHSSYRTAAGAGQAPSNRSIPKHHGDHSFFFKDFISKREQFP